MKALPSLLLLPITLAVGQALAADTPQLEEVVVTSSRSARPLTISTDPHHARQPVPAADGAGLLKNIPGFSVTRKGGASGDPLLRGLGGSRLAVLADGGFVYGGCGGRMDPPTAYLYPESYDRVEVIKGPQSVRYGSPLVAGAVRFERDTPRFEQATIKGQASLLAGSFDRRDAYADVTAGGPLGYARAIATHSESGDYRDGDGTRVHSEFKRDSNSLLLGLTPDAYSTLQLSADRSRGVAAYADRGMDGSRFDRDAWGLQAERRALNGWLDALRLQYSHSYADHVMDNFTLRPTTPPAKRALGNPDRETDTARVEADLGLGEATLTAGIDWQRDRHRSRSGLDFESKPRLPNQAFDQQGAYLEGRQPLGDTGKLIAGLRRDHVDATYERYASDNPQRRQRYTLNSGFVRYEQRHGAWLPFVGLGQAERAPDYWERLDGDPLRKERGLQLDVGSHYRAGNVEAALSAYLGRVKDFILVKYQQNAGTYNVDARRAGLEGELNWRFAPAWKLGATVAYAYGKNRSADTPLAQTPPPEAGLTLGWDDGQYAVGALWRLVAKQGRVAVGDGNIVSYDQGSSPGFGVLSLNAGWRVSKALQLSAGIDNLLDKSYAEHVSKKGAMVTGYQQTSRVGEPGRTLWLKLQGKWH